MKHMTNNQKTLFLLKIPNINSFKLNSIYKKNINLVGGNLKYNKNGHIDWDKEFKNKYNKNSGKFNIVIDDNKYYYKVERYSSNENEINEDTEFKFIDLITIEDEYENNIDCGNIVIDIKNNTASITSLGSNTKCIKSKNNIKFKYGDILFQIMLYICKKENIKQIEITDNAYIQCGSIRLNLNCLKTLTHGYPHYHKYGFIYKNKKDNKILEKNKQIFTSEPKINKNQLVLLIKNNFDKKNIIETVINILNKYEKKYNNNVIPIQKFVKLLSLDLNNTNFCELLESIYMDLFEIAGYSKYFTQDFVLVLK